MTKIINLTPHAINFLDGNNSVLATIEPSGTIARASQTRETVGNINGIAVNQCSYGEVTGLPDPQADTIYLVSALTAQACRDRSDVFITDDAVRDDSGRIIGCRAIARI